MPFPQNRASRQTDKDLAKREEQKVLPSHDRSPSLYGLIFQAGSVVPEKHSNAARSQQLVFCRRLANRKILSPVGDDLAEPGLIVANSLPAVRPSPSDSHRCS